MKKSQHFSIIRLKLTSKNHFLIILEVIGILKTYMLSNGKIIF